MPEFRVEFTRGAQNGKFRAALYYPPDATKPAVRTRPIYPSEDPALVAVVKPSPMPRPAAKRKRP